MILLVCNIWNFANYTIITIVDIKTTFMASEDLDTTIDAYYSNLAKVDIVDNLPFDISVSKSNQRWITHILNAIYL